MPSQLTAATTTATTMNNANRMQIEGNLKRDAPSLSQEAMPMDVDKEKREDRVLQDTTATTNAEAFRTPLKRGTNNIPVVMQGYSPSELAALVADFRAFVAKDPKTARDLFTANPQLAYAALYGLKLSGELNAEKMDAMIRTDSAIAPSEIVPPPPASIPAPPTTSIN